MSTRSEPFLTWVGRALASYRYIVYLGGIIVILLPRLLRVTAGTSLPLQTRRILVGGALAIMIFTYLAERQFAHSHNDSADTHPNPSAAPEYSLYARLSLAGAAVGVAIGIYVGFAMERLFLGMLFIFGAYLFVRMGYRHEEQTRGGS